MLTSDIQLKIAIVLFILGATLFFLGLKKLKMVWRMSITPLSKISSASIGRHVEIEGQVFGNINSLITSPLSKKLGVCFIWELQRWIGKGFTKWQPELYLYSTPFLYLQDSSDAIAAIDLATCEFEEEVIHFTSEEFSDRIDSIPKSVKNLMGDYMKKPGFISESYRIRERVFALGERIYVHGTAHSVPSEETTKSRDKKRVVLGSGKFKDRVFKTLQMLKRRTDIIRRFDKNNDGVLDKSELVILQKEIENKIFREYNLSAKYLSMSRIFFSTFDGPGELLQLDKVYISNTPEDKRLPKMKWESYGAVFGGALLFAVGLTILLNYFWA